MEPLLKTPEDKPDLSGLTAPTACVAANRKAILDVFERHRVIDEIRSGANLVTAPLDWLSLDLNHKKLLKASPVKTDRALRGKTLEDAIFSHVRGQRFANRYQHAQIFDGMRSLIDLYNEISDDSGPIWWRASLNSRLAKGVHIDHRKRAEPPKGLVPNYEPRVLTFVIVLAGETTRYFEESDVQRSAWSPNQEFTWGLRERAVEHHAPSGHLVVMTGGYDGRVHNGPRRFLGRWAHAFGGRAVNR